MLLFVVVDLLMDRAGFYFHSQRLRGFFTAGRIASSLLVHRLMISSS